MIGNTIGSTMYIEGGFIGFSGIKVTNSTAPASPMFQTRLAGSDIGFVTALQGASA